MHPNNALQTILGAMHPKPVFAHTRKTSLRRSSRRSRVLCPRHFDSLPLRIATVSRHAIRSRVADILQRHPLPLESIRRRRIRKSGRFVRASIRTRTHGVAGAAGHADAAVGVSLGVGEVGWAVEAGAAVCWTSQALRWRDGRCVAFSAFDGDAAVVVETGCALVSGHRGLDVGVEGDGPDGGGRVRILYLFGRSRRDEAHRWRDSRIGNGICESWIARGLRTGSRLVSLLGLWRCQTRLLLRLLPNLLLSCRRLLHVICWWWHASRWLWARLLRCL
jgi:hypothetical protein